MTNGVGVTVIAEGCCDGGSFFMRKKSRRKEIVHKLPFEFETEVHVRCAPQRPECIFPVTVQQSGDIWFVSGVLSCNCVDENSALRDLSWRATEANATYSAKIESVLYYEHSFF